MANAFVSLYVLLCVSEELVNGRRMKMAAM